MFFHQSYTCICGDKWSRTTALFQVKQPSSGHCPHLKINTQSSLSHLLCWLFFWSSLPVSSSSPGHSRETQCGCRFFPAGQILFIFSADPVRATSVTWAVQELAQVAEAWGQWGALTPKLWKSWGHCPSGFETNQFHTFYWELTVLCLLQA